MRVAHTCRRWLSACMRLSDERRTYRDQRRHKVFTTRRLRVCEIAALRLTRIGFFRDMV